MKPRLLITADDLGYAPAVTHGIFEAHAFGVVTAASLMVNLPDAESAAQRARAEAPALEIGLHLNFTRGKPCAPSGEIASLVDRDGCFWLRHQQEFALVSGAELRTEMRAQLRRFEQLTGTTPAHVNVHRRWLEDLLIEEVAPLAAGCDACVRARTEASRAVARRCGARVCDCVLGDVTIRGLEPEWTFDHLLLSLSKLSQGVVTTLRVAELVCHPGRAHDEELSSRPLGRRSSYCWQREAELRLFGSPALKPHLNRVVQMTTFEQLRG